MQKKREPLLIVVSAPSGSGKTTIVEGLMDKMPGIKRSVSYTTRQPREGERDNVDYIFVSRDEFARMAENGEFLECEENFGCRYGTSAEQVSKALREGEDIILSIDVKGARKVKKAFPESISVFIMPPSREELAKRLRKRNTDDQQQMELRLKEAEREIADAGNYDYLIVNKDLGEAIEELRGIIEKEKGARTTSNQEEL